MARIPQFDAGEGRLQPSEAGSAAFREAGAITQRNAARVGAMIEQTGTSISGGLKAFGGTLSKMEDAAKDHNDAMANIDFENQLTKAEIAAQGGINLAAAPKDSSGKPILENTPARAGVSLPDDATVPTPGQYATTADATLKGHATLLDNMVGNIGGFWGVSQAARDKMALRAAQSNRQLQVHAAAVEAQNQFDHALTITGETEKEIYAGVNRGEIPLDTALAHIDRTYDALSGALSGDFAIKGGPLIEATKRQAHQNAIWQAAAGQVMKGNIDGARAIINDKAYDKYIGGPEREKLLASVNGIQDQWLKDDAARRTAGNQQRSDDQNNLTYQILQNSKLPPDKQDPNLTRANMENLKPFVGDAAGLEKARKIIDSEIEHTADPLLSQQHLAAVMRGITDGSIKTDAQIEQRFRPGQADSMSWGDLTHAKQLLKDANDNPAVKEFNAKVKEWMTNPGNQSQIDRKMIDSTGNISPITKTALGQTMLDRWHAEVQRRADIMRRNGEDPHELLDTNSPKSMVTPKALAPYVVTDQMAQQFQANQKASSADINAQRQQGTMPTGTPEIPSNLKNTKDLGFNEQSQQWYDPATKQTYSVDGRKAPMLGAPPLTPDLNKPVVMPKGTTPDQIKQQLQPGQKFIIEHDDGKKYQGTVPGKRSDAGGQLNFAADAEGLGNSAAQRAISSAIFHDDGAKTEAASAPAGTARAVTDQTQRLENVRGYGQQLTGSIVINGHNYHFINGGGGRGSIPFGSYSVSNFRSAEQRASQGLIHLGDTFDLNDVRDPLAGGTRTALRIHAAHGQGTLGCIGILGGPDKFEQFAKDMKAAGVTKLVLGPQGMQTAAK